MKSVLTIILVYVIVRNVIRYFWGVSSVLLDLPRRAGRKL